MQLQFYRKGHVRCPNLSKCRILEEICNAFKSKVWKLWYVRSGRIIEIDVYWVRSYVYLYLLVELSVAKTPNQYLTPSRTPIRGFHDKEICEISQI